MELFKHQQEALEQTKDLNRVAYYLDMGLGKTFVGAEKMKVMNSPVNLIVCQKSKIQDWIDHFNEHYAIDERSAFQKDLIFDLTNKKAFQAFINEAQQATEDHWIQDELTGEYYRQENLYPFNVVGVINYELAWRRKQLLQLQDFTLMLDESSLIQNQGAKQSKFILQLHPDNVILLSGTPTAGKYENLWSQIHLLGWNISEDVYNRQYVNWTKIDMGGFIHKIVDKENPYKNVDRLKSKLREHGAVFMKTEECFDLPEQTFIKQTVPTSKEYWKFMKDCIITVGKSSEDGYVEDVFELVGDTTLTKRLYARQLCGQYSEFKLQAFKELVQSTQDRLIVFYNFNAELELLKRIAASLDRPISEVNGQTKDLTAYEQEDNSITFIQYQAGAMGLNLQKANKIIYFTLTDKSELFEQSKKRIHRIGQEQPCFYYILMCKGSVEEVILQTLEMRKDFTDELFNEYERMENNG
ncbi:DEAD/DEAH box helicase [Dielma fastidiosa]|uniref:SNF2-related protein n=1 Tax=Dielma fastidiosa TaxID=1034346 RepID=UPI000E4C4797|nr:DEAD/DEAH box helicase [Dielma fastidiosa]RHM98339.1 ATP-dependent helicase [Dielma fastidiosa]